MRARGGMTRGVRPSEDDELASSSGNTGVGSSGLSQHGRTAAGRGAAGGRKSLSHGSRGLMDSSGMVRGGSSVTRSSGGGGAAGRCSAAERSEAGGSANPGGGAGLGPGNPPYSALAATSVGIGPQRMEQGLPSRGARTRGTRGSAVPAGGSPGEVPLRSPSWAPRLASLSASSFPSTPRCPRTQLRVSLPATGVQAGGRARRETKRRLRSQVHSATWRQPLRVAPAGASASQVGPRRGARSARRAQPART